MITPKTHLPRINGALEGFDKLPDAAFVRLPIVGGLLGVSNVTVWRWTKQGRLPAAVKVGGVTAWNVGALRRTFAVLNAGGGYGP